MKDNHQAITLDDYTDLSIHSPWRIDRMEEKMHSMAKGNFCSIVLREVLVNNI